MKRSIYTGKAFAETTISTENKILAVKKNAVDLKTDGGEASVEKLAVTLSESDFARKLPIRNELRERFCYLKRIL